MRLILIDFECYYSKTYSLRKMTIPEYILGNEYETIGCAVIDGINSKPFWLEGDDVANYLRGIDLTDVGICAHNTPFDGSILSLRYNIYPAFYFDTMAMARAQVSHLTNGRVSLDAVSKHFGLPEKGKAIHKVEGLHLQEIKEAGFYDEYVDYSLHDVELCRDIFKLLMPDFPDGELKVIDELIHMVTQPQFAINRGLLVAHLASIRERKEGLLRNLGYSKLELMSNDKFALALESCGAVPPRKISLTTGVETWAFAKTDKQFQDLTEHEDETVQALVAARLGHKSTLEESRTERFIAIADATQQGLGYTAMPVPLRYSGAHTHRFCLTGDTIIVTLRDNHVVHTRLDGLRDDDLVWDGEAFVSHGGLAYAGEKEVIEYDDVVGTPDHRVWTVEHGYLQLAEAKAGSYHIARGAVPDAARIDPTVQRAHQVSDRG